MRKENEQHNIAKDSGRIIGIDIHPSCFAAAAFPRVKNLDVSNNHYLEYLACSDNQLSSLSLTRIPSLKTLYCGGNKLSSLNSGYSFLQERIYALSDLKVFQTDLK